MDYRHIAVHPAAGALGAEVSGVDLRETLDDETFSEIAVFESDAPLSYLYDHQALPEFTCRFRWQKNSIAVWDNRAVQHRAVADNLEARRRMERVTVEGDRPV
jgi:alpha-ketoglutarate-dependent taurine dioxygenase